jgi:hypothetical protein
MRLPGAAVRVVLAPDGTEWKIYVARFRFPRWRPSDYDQTPKVVGGEPGIVLIAADAVLSVLNDLLIPLLRFVVTLPFVLVGSSNSSKRTIEAVTVWPHEERYVWETDAADVQGVVDEVAAGLERGTFAQPAQAIFYGRSP